MADIVVDCIDTFLSTYREENDEAVLSSLERVSTNMKKLSVCEKNADMLSDAFMKLTPALNEIIDEHTPSISQVFKDAFENPIDNQNIEKLRPKVELTRRATGLALEIMTIPELDRRIVMEELVDSLLTCYRSTLQNLVFPSVDCTIRNQLRITTCTASATSSASAAAAAAAKKKKNSKKAKTDGSERKTERTAVKSAEILGLEALRVIQQHALRLGDLVSRTTLLDRQLLEICSAAYLTLPVVGKGIVHLQIASLELVHVTYIRCERYRDAIVQDAINVVSKLPTSPKRLRLYRLTHEANSIQMISALVLQLAQSATRRTGLDVQKNDENEYDAHDDENENGAHDDASHLETKHSARYVLHFFMSSLLAKCASKEHGKAFCRVFENLVEDYLLLLNQPEWPASSVAILITCELLCQALPDLPQKNAKGTFVQTRLTGGSANHAMSVFALRTLGLVSRRLQIELLNESVDPLISADKTTPVELKGVPTSSEEVVNCVCGQTTLPNGDGEFMLDCDGCHEWFHGQCVGVPRPRSQKEADELEFFCDRCLMKKQIALQIEREAAWRTRRQREEGARTRKKSEKRQRETSYNKRPRRRRKKPRRFDCLSDDEEDEECNSGDARADDDCKEQLSLRVSRQLVLNYLTLKAQGGDRNASLARRYFITQWSVNEYRRLGPCLVFDDLQADLLAQWTLPSSKTHSLPPALSRGRTIAICRSFAVDETLRNLSMIVLHRLLGTLMANRTSTRAEAVKAIGITLTANPDLMSHSNVKDSVEARLRDKSIKVRETVLDLVGKHVVSRPELISKYYEVIKDRLNDRGISVRKRAVGILKTILATRPEHPKRLDICKRLIALFDSESTSSEESLRAVICDAFRNIWFAASVTRDDDDEVVTSPSKHVANDGSLPPGWRFEGASPRRQDESCRARRVLISPKGQRCRSVDEAWQYHRSESPSSTSTSLSETTTTSMTVFERMLAGEMAHLSTRGSQQLANLLAKLYVVDDPCLEESSKTKCGLKAEEDVKKRCKGIVRSLVGILLRCEDDLAIPKRLLSASHRMSSVLSALTAFAKVDPLLLTDHVDVLSVHLKNDPHLREDPRTRSDRIIVYATDVVATVLPHVKYPDRSKVWAILKDLRSVILSREPHVVEASIKCLAVAARVLGKEGRLAVLNLVQTLYRYLFCRKSLPNLEKESMRVVNSIERALYTVGNVCRIIDLDKSTEECGVLAQDGSSLSSLSSSSELPPELKYGNVANSF
eukprot:g5104.t1